jgi:hypothetical protein
MKSLTVIIGAILVYLGFQSKAKAETSFTSTANFGDTVKNSLDDLYKKYGDRFSLDPLLLKAIAQVESSENPKAKNPADPSYGLMQLLCVPDGQGGCKNRLNVLGWPPENVEKLYDPDYSVYIGAQILSWNQGRYGFNKGIAVYNSWSAHTAPQEGPFPNQGYLDKVLLKYRALGGLTASYSGYSSGAGGTF